MTLADNLLAKGVSAHKYGVRTDSAAQLSWFLENVWRLDPADVESAICDGNGDKGIDAIVIDDDLGEVTVLQGKWANDPTKSRQGDAVLKALVGAADYFKSAATVQGLLDSKPNEELTKLLLRQEVKEKIASGSHIVNLIFVTNADLDPSASDYVKARSSLAPTLEVWSRKKLTEIASRTARPQLRKETVTLTAFAEPTLAKLTATEKLAIAIVPASELVKLPGLDDHTLFSRNVRLYVGSTRINNELRNTVQDVEQHSLFPAYHNGLTLLTEKIKVIGNKITLSKVGVVNGCQSLTTLYDYKTSVTTQLTLLVKIVEVPENSDASELITYRSNNQNSVTMRDQRSSDPVMRDLQRSVANIFGSDFGLIVRAGETLAAKERMDNAVAAQLVMAVYLREPWAAVRKVRLFDQDYRRIFNREVTPERLRLLDLINMAVFESRTKLRKDLRTSFASVKFTLAYLVAEVCRISAAGRLLIDSPDRWLPGGEADIRTALKEIAAEVVSSVNFFVKAELDEDATKDPKIMFKSKSGVESLDHEVLRNARRDADRGTASYLFELTPPTKRPASAATKKVARKTPPAKRTPPLATKKVARKKAGQKTPARKRA